MPQLKQLSCTVQWSDTGAPFQEYGTQYGDGVVESYIVVPNKPQSFTIHLKSLSYIFDGLAVVTFIDGNYQANRNRVNLRPRKKDTPLDRTQVDFLFRQREKPIGEGVYMGREWRFDNHNIVEQLPEGVKESHFESLGTIEVLVLRCRARVPEEVDESGSSSAADSDALGDKGERVVIDLEEGKGKKKTSRNDGTTEQGFGGDAANDGNFHPYGLNPGGGQPGHQNWTSWPPTSSGHSRHQSQHQQNFPPHSAAPPKQVRFNLNAQYPQSSNHGPPRPASYDRSRFPAYASSNHVNVPTGVPNIQQPPSIPGPQLPLYGGGQFPDMGPFQHQQQAFSTPLQPNMQPPNFAMPHASVQQHQPQPQPSVYSQFYAPPQPQFPMPAQAYHAAPPPPPVSHQYQAPQQPQAPVYAQSFASQPPSAMDAQTPHHPPHYPQAATIDPFTPNRTYWPAQPPHYVFNPYQQSANSAWPVHSVPYPPNFPMNPSPATINGSSMGSNNGGVSQQNNSNSQSAGSNNAPNGSWNGWNNGSNTNVSGSGIGYPSTNNDPNGNQAVVGGTWGDTNANTAADNNWNSDTTANNNTSGWNEPTNSDTQNNNMNQNWGDSGQSGNDNGNDSWANNNGGDNTTNPADNDNWANNDTTSNVNDGWGNDDNDAPAGANESNAASDEKADAATRTLFGPHGQYYAIRSRGPDEPEPDAEEEPRYDVPRKLAQATGSTKQVLPGSGYMYWKKRRAPEYIDTMEEPYARFVFKYRTKDQVGKEIGIEVDVEPSGDQAIQELQDMDKQSLIEMLVRATSALGGKVPSPRLVAASLTGESNVPVAVDPPDRPFLKYKLPEPRQLIKNIPSQDLGKEKDQGKSNGNGGGGGAWSSDWNANNNDNTQAVGNDDWTGSGNQNSGGNHGDWNAGGNQSSGGANVNWNYATWDGQDEQSQGNQAEPGNEAGEKSQQQSSHNEQNGSHQHSWGNTQSSNQAAGTSGSGGLETGWDIGASGGSAVSSRSTLSMDNVALAGGNVQQW